MNISISFEKSFQLAIIPLFLLLPLLPSCSGATAGPPPKPAAPVTIGTVIQGEAPAQLSAIGNVEAYNTVSVKSQVGGELVGVHFTEGQFVKKGSRLFTIDPRPYEAALKQAEANLGKDMAQLENALSRARRYDEIAKEGIISQEMDDQVRTNAAAFEAAVEADKAIIENARLQLQHCYIDAPLSGMTGNLIVDQGNLIKANPDLPMVVINQIHPIHVSFAVPEQYLPEIKEYWSAGKIKVDAFPAKGEEPVSGELSFVDNAVDAGTGTIELKATFANEEDRLWPGQFVSIVMTLTTRSDAILVPSQAVQAGQAGEYVFVVKDDLTVESRPVVIGETVNNQAIVEQGLQPGERVVTDGQLRLTPGSKVEIRNGGGASAAVAAGASAGAEKP